MSTHYNNAFLYTLHTYMYVTIIITILTFWSFSYLLLLYTVLRNCYNFSSTLPIYVAHSVNIDIIYTLCTVYVRIQYRVRRTCHFNSENKINFKFNQNINFNNAATGRQS